MGYPTIYPTGVTIYKPEKCWRGLTIFEAQEVGALLIDMSGKEVNLWKGVQGMPNKILPGGFVISSRGRRSGRYGMQDGIDLVQLDWDGKVVWKFDHYEKITDPGHPAQWMARFHHDFQREGSPTGYYAPDMAPKTDSGNTILLVHHNARNPEISDKPLIDDAVIEVDWDGNILWEWRASDHFDEFGFREGAKNILSRDPNLRDIHPEKAGDWMHMNSVSLLGPNKHYDAGDERFHPDNLILSSRETNIVFIVSKKTGKVVWKLGPYFDDDPKLKEIGWIIGQHHAHMIPKTLPGGGNLLIFDNGGWAGYDVPNPGAPKGIKAAQRDFSRVLEIDPVTLEIVWQYTPAEAGFLEPMDSSRFYSPFISSAQRLPNGNTLITEGFDGRIFEITPQYEIVWEYVSPYKGTAIPMNMIYRAYRVPYEWVPQVKPEEPKAIEPLDLKTFRVPGAAPFGDREREVTVEGCTPFEGSNALCVATKKDPKTGKLVFRTSHDDH